MKTLVLIPAYNPDSNMELLVQDLYNEGFDILIVNDGSDVEYTPLFDSVRGYAEVIEYSVNKGKGYALKTGIRHIVENRADITGFVTADADGQHTVTDIKRVANALETTDSVVLGLRNLKGNIPLRSRIGNDLSRCVYAFVTGKYLTDNQAGLRGFPIELADWLVSVSGNRYEYEMNVLAEGARKNLRITEMPIETVYNEGNKSSHFKPVPDTLRIQGQLFKNGFVSFFLYSLCLIGILHLSQLNMKYSNLMIAVWTLLFFIVHVLVLHIHDIPRKFTDRRFSAFSAICIAAKYLSLSLFFALIYFKTGMIALSIAVPIAIVLCITFVSGRTFAFFKGNRLLSRKRKD